MNCAVVYKDQTAYSRRPPLYKRAAKRISVARSDVTFASTAAITWTGRGARAEGRAAARKPNGTGLQRKGEADEIQTVGVSKGEGRGK